MTSKYNHLALVRRDDVIDLFKNGVIFPASTIQFSGSIETLPEKTNEVKKVFDKMPPIEYSINYFFLYVVAEKKTSLLSQGLNIHELVSIIPLDEESFKMGLSLNPPVQLSDPLFSSNFIDYQKDLAIENAKKGVNNIGLIFGFKDLMKSITKFNEKKSLPALVSLVCDETGQLKPQSIWEYLICYNRNQTYPNDTRGAFLDTMSVVNNYKKGYIDFKDQKLTTTGRAILELSEHSKYNELAECVGASKPLVDNANKAYPNFWKIAPLYFILLKIFSNIFDDGSIIMGKPIQEFVSSIVKNYEEASLKPALLMLGITLGQSSTYKMLYAIKKSEYSFLK